MIDTNIHTAAISILRDAGLLVDSITFDGALHRVPTTDKPHDKDGSYVAHGDEPVSLWWQNWRTGESGTWTAKRERNFTPAEREAFRKRMEETKKAREEEQEQRYTEAGQKAQAIYKAAIPCQSHAYLTAKGVKPVSDLKVSNQPEKYPALIVPMYKRGFEIVGLQFIHPDKTKRFLSGSKKKGSFFPIGKAPDKPLIICEGLSTGLSIHEATGLPCLVAFDAGNLKPAAVVARKVYPEREIIIYADNDIEEGDKNTGVDAARQAALAVSGYLAIPELKTGGKCDANDLFLAEGAGAVKAVIHKAIAAGIVTKEESEEEADPGLNSLEKKESESLPETDDELIARLAGLPPLDYARVRVKEAKRLGISVGLLDKIIRREINGAQATDGVAFKEVTPWPKPVKGDDLLFDIARTIQRFIICEAVTAHAAALWVAMTWLIDEIQIAPLAIITAPEKRCGKSLLLSILGMLSCRPLVASNISPSAVYRAIEAWKPTLIIDEADAFMRDNEEIRGVLNSGHTRDSAYVIRNVGDEHTPRQFSTWGAKAIAGIGRQAGTIMDRAIILDLRRKTSQEKVTRLRHAEPNLFSDLASCLCRFSEDNREAVRLARPELPQALNDRAQDNWEPLLAIADVAGGDWPKMARKAALTISGNKEDDTSVGVELLSDIWEIFEEKDIDRISTADLLEELCKDDEKPWSTYNRGKAISARQISTRFKGYGIAPKLTRFGINIARGYDKEQFRDAVARYSPNT